MKLKVQNFGPIRENITENEGYVEINDLTVFIGNQGTGKSTIAKLVSTFSWLEKALFRGYIKESFLTSSIFKNKYCKYQKIDDYFDKSGNSYIHFIGYIYEFEYINNDFTINHLQKDSYLVPQIMYVPAERNFLSTVDRPRSLKPLPAPLYTFLDEFEIAEIAYKDGIPLPLNNIQFEYSPQNKLAYIVGENYKIRLSEASSGIQSLVPLFIVSQHLAYSIEQKKDYSTSEKSLEEKKKLEAEVEKILFNQDLSEEVKMSSLKIISSKFKKECFFNIVEEIEQNFYPISQKNVLFKLIEFLNMTQGNRLILTTHSPYIIDYLSLAIKAKKILNKKNESLIDKIVPVKSCIEPNRVSIYELEENGTMKKLSDYEGIPSDNNFLNNLLAETNELYSELQEIEDEYEN